MSNLSRTKKENRPISNRLILIGLLCSIVLILSSLFLLLKPFESNKKVDYFSIENPIIYNGQIFAEGAIFVENEVYVPFEFLQTIDETIIYDKASESVIITTADQLLQFSVDQLTKYINEEPFSIEIPSTITADNQVYVALQPLTAIYPIQISYNDETHVTIIKRDGVVELPAVVRQTEKPYLVRIEPSERAPYVEEIYENEIVIVEKDVDQYYLIRKENGVGGYVPKEAITLQQPTVIHAEIEKEQPVVPPVEWPINLTWEAVYASNPDTNSLPALPGVNIVSPTWFHIKNDSADISNLGSSAYVDWAKEQGYQIWGLFSNNFDPELTHEVLKDFSTRQKMIRQLLQYSQMYNLDGINIDFENVNLEDRDNLTQFMRELTPILHQAGLVVSIDITFISSSENWSMFYDREKLATIVDYLVVMAYDEHWATSPVAGSVASFPWVEENLKRLLDVVPREKVILGIPTYARIWKEQETAGGNIEISSKAYSMESIQEWIKERNLTPTLDDKSGQHYVEYYDDSERATYKAWIEDEYSIAKRAQLVHRYGLAGVASWNRYFADKQSWESLKNSLETIEVTE